MVTFGPCRPRSLCACNPDGDMMGDAVLFCERENEVSIIGKPTVERHVQKTVRVRVDPKPIKRH